MTKILKFPNRDDAPKDFFSYHLQTDARSSCNMRPNNILIIFVVILSISQVVEPQVAAAATAYTVSVVFSPVLAGFTSLGLAALAAITRPGQLRAPRRKIRLMKICFSLNNSGKNSQAIDTAEDMDVQHFQTKSARLTT